MAPTVGGESGEGTKCDSPVTVYTLTMSPDMTQSVVSDLTLLPAETQYTDVLSVSISCSLTLVQLTG